MLVPLIIILLLLTTTSWIAPLLFLITIGVAVLINMGTNVVFGEISFVTQSVSPIMQLAVSLDYAIFLLNSFERHRREVPDPEEAAAWPPRSPSPPSRPRRRPRFSASSRSSSCASA